MRPKKLFANEDRRAQGEGHALDEGPWSAAEKRLSTVRTEQRNNNVSSIQNISSLQLDPANEKRGSMKIPL